MKPRLPTILLFLLTLLVSSLSLAQSEKNPGLELRKRVDSGDRIAVSIMMKNAADGDSNSQYYLGMMYANGTGVPQSDTDAVKWFRLAAQQGNPDGELSLGNMYAIGQGVNQDYAQAVKWYSSAAKTNVDAQITLAEMYEVGRGVPRNTAEAQKWYSKAAGHGDQKNTTIANAAAPQPVVPLALSLATEIIDGAGSTDGIGINARFSNSTCEQAGNIEKGIAVDSAGNIYVADVGNHTIRKISTKDAVTTLAGKAGSPGSTDGTGTEARFNCPTGIALDANDNLYVTDSANHTIRKISPTGNVTTIAGKAGVAGKEDGIGWVARFKRPEGITVNDKGIIYIADALNADIRQIDPDGVVKTLAGRGRAGFIDGTGRVAMFNHPIDLTVDQQGFIYVADELNGAIRKISPDGVVTTFLGAQHRADKNDDDSRMYTKIDAPKGIGIDDNGTLYFTTFNQIVRIGANRDLAALGRKEGKGSVDGIGRNAAFSVVGHVAADKLGNLYVADNYLIRKVDPDGRVTTIAGRVRKEGIGVPPNGSGSLSALK